MNEIMNFQNGQVNDFENKQQMKYKFRVIKRKHLVNTDYIDGILRKIK